MYSRNAAAKYTDDKNDTYVTTILTITAVTITTEKLIIIKLKIS